MKSAFLNPKATWTLLVVLSITSLLVIYAALSIQRKGILTEMTSVELSCFTYALRQGDDMTVIDRGKELERRKNVLAFRLTDGSRTIMEGGNRDHLSKGHRPDVSWITAVESDGNKNIELGIAYDSSRAQEQPLTWGLLSALFCFAAGTLAMFTSRNTPNAPVVPNTPTAPAAGSPTVRLQAKTVSPSLLEESGTVLFVDKNYIVRQATVKAARLLGIDGTNSLQVHFLDLRPSPGLMQALERSEEMELVGAFPSHPTLTVALRNDPNGTFLFLEGAADSREAQKR